MNFLYRKDGHLRVYATKLLEIKEHLTIRPFQRLALANRKNLVGAEVGVFQGKNARKLLSYCDLKILYLVDAYSATTQYDQATLDAARQQAQARLSKFANCKWLRMTSVAAAKSLAAAGDLLDFVYIDGAHDYDSVRADLAAWFPLVKKGGWLGGHDIQNGGDHTNDGVVQAVTEFTVQHKFSLKVCGVDWWFLK